MYRKHFNSEDHPLPLWNGHYKQLATPLLLFKVYPSGYELWEYLLGYEIVIFPAVELFIEVPVTSRGHYIYL